MSVWIYGCSSCRCPSPAVAPYSSIRRHTGSSSHHASYFRQSVAVSRPCAGKAPQRPLSVLEQAPAGTGICRYVIHDLRHTFASFLVNAGHSLYEAQKMLGHGDPRPTTRYAHLGQTSLLAAAETVSCFFSPRKSSGRTQGFSRRP